MLDFSTQKKIALELDRSPAQVMKKLEDIRHMISLRNEQERVLYITTKTIFLF